MKRMNEVLGPLPVDPEDFTDPCYPNEKDEHVYIAHAINHVDALADALEFLLNLPRGSSGRIIIEKSEESAAIEALNAYRGVK